MTAYFRDLFNELNAYRGYAIYHDVFVPWIDRAREALEECRQFREPTPFDPRDESACMAMWNLYALNRVNDYLLMAFLPKGRWMKQHQRLNVFEYEAFFGEIGMTVVRSEEFAPFQHEIVRVHAADEPDEPIRLFEARWPALLFGRMLFSREGADVTGGRNFVNPEIAERSNLYWAFHRTNRPVRDLSNGWGSNSQWRTSIRRDFACEDRRIYNFDGNVLLNGDSISDDWRDKLTHSERVELVRHRSFILSSSPDEGLFPWDYRYEEPLS